MKTLTNNDLSIVLNNDDSKTELGEIARAILVFKENMVERQKAEREIEKAHDDLSAQMHNIVMLR